MPRSAPPHPIVPRAAALLQALRSDKLVTMSDTRAGELDATEREKRKNLKESRTTALGPLLQQPVFGSVSRSLFKRDRMTYAMHMIHLLHPGLFGEVTTALPLAVPPEQLE